MLILLNKHVVDDVKGEASLGAVDTASVEADQLTYLLKIQSACMQKKMSILNAVYILWKEESCGIKPVE